MVAEPRQRLLGQAPEFERVMRAAQLVAATDATVLLTGESGTGKELVARSIHDASPRADRAFVAINCAGIPEGLIESELFGHRKGAFTGAVSDSPGHVQAAEGGSLFLDEVAELPAPTQAKLLRFLESRECQSVGQRDAEQVDVRIIAATNRDLAEAVEQGSFRADLYYRLYVVPLELPALRQRTADIPVLLDHFVIRLGAEHALEPPHFGNSAMKLLTQYRWPGNVRELRNFCERMVILFAGRRIEAENLPLDIRRGSDAHKAESGRFVLPESGIRLQDLEVDMIRQALAMAGGNKSRAARLLGLTRDTLLYRIQKYVIQT
jgi:DNA-binding NtrC family response regulator